MSSKLMPSKLMPSKLISSKFRLSIFSIVCVIFLMTSTTGCATKRPDGHVGFWDKYEQSNRKVHKFNQWVDSKLLKPLAVKYKETISLSIRSILKNAARNIFSVKDIFLYILQGRMKLASIAFARLIINSTLGLWGMFNPAGEMGLQHRSTSFGATLKRWGVPQGPYIELPIFGPSSARGIVDRLLSFGIPNNKFVSGFYNLTPTQEGLITATGLLEFRVSLLDFENFTRQGDTYTLFREAYLSEWRERNKRKNKQSKDGENSDEFDEFDDFGEFDDFEE